MSQDQKFKELLIALQRIALNVCGDTPSQVIAGDAIDKYKLATQSQPDAKDKSQ